MNDEQGPAHAIRFRAVAAVSLVLCAILIGNGFLNSRRVEHRAAARTTTLRAMNIQQLAARMRECDPPDGSAPINRDADFCAEVMRAIEAQPLQAVRIER